MTTISDKAIAEIKANNRIIGRLMILFDRGQNTIENWMASKDPRLTTPDAVKIIKEESALVDQEILDDTDKVEALTNGTTNIG